MIPTLWTLTALLGITLAWDRGARGAWLIAVVLIAALLPPVGIASAFCVPEQTP